MVLPWDEGQTGVLSVLVEYTCLDAVQQDHEWLPFEFA